MEGLECSRQYDYRLTETIEKHWQMMLQTKINQEDAIGQLSSICKKLVTNRKTKEQDTAKIQSIRQEFIDPCRKI